MTTDHAHVRQYSMDTLEGIARDLWHNRKSRMKGSWECERLAAIKAELKRRRRAVAK